MEMTEERVGKVGDRQKFFSMKQKEKKKDLEKNRASGICGAIVKCLT